MHRQIYQIIFTFFITLFFLGCSFTDPDPKTKNETQEIEKKLHALENSLEYQQNKQKKSHLEMIQTIKDTNTQLDISLSSQIQQLQEEQAKTHALLQELKCKKQPEPIVIYKEKKKELYYKDSKLVVGEAEDVKISPPNIIARARIDSGAETSSLDAREITEFERDGERWVRFFFVNRSNQEKHLVERKISRYVRITQSSDQENTHKRPVVQLKLTMGSISELSEFTLTDREHMQFPVLIGRNALKDVAIVDVSAEDLAPLLEEKN